MSEKKDQFPKQFIGPSYTSRVGRFDCQRSVNLYLEKDMSGDTGKSGEQAVLVGTPGLNLLQTLGDGPIRALYTDSTNHNVYAVSGDTAYKMPSNFLFEAIGTAKLNAAAGGPLPITQPTGGAATTNDPHTKILMHFDGTLGTKVFVDDAGNTTTYSGTPELNTPSKFGSSSLQLDGVSWVTISSTGGHIVAPVTLSINGLSSLTAVPNETITWSITNATPNSQVKLQNSDLVGSTITELYLRYYGRPPKYVSGVDETIYWCGQFGVPSAGDFVSNSTIISNFISAANSELTSSAWQTDGSGNWSLATVLAPGAVYTNMTHQTVTATVAGLDIGRNISVTYDGFSPAPITTTTTPAPTAAPGSATFYSGGTWTVPSLVSTIYVTGSGAGGGGASGAPAGGGHYGTPTAGGGGGGAASISGTMTYSVTAGDVLTITNGVAGAGGVGGGAYYGNIGSPGGNTSIVSNGATTILFLGGGQPGKADGAYAFAPDLGGAGGTGTTTGTGTIVSGGAGGDVPLDSPTGGTGGTGGGGRGGDAGGAGNVGSNGAASWITITW